MLLRSRKKTRVTRAQPSKSESQSAANSPTHSDNFNRRQHVKQQGEKLQTINLSLFDPSLLLSSKKIDKMLQNDEINFKQIGVYHKMKVTELRTIIQTMFQLPSNVQIIGIKSYKNSQCLIPLSYLSNNPDSLLSNTTNEMYQLILDRSLPITSISRWKALW
eukprot:181461_1